MFGRYQTYPKYKNSGIEWLGKIPLGWSVKKLAWSFKAEKGKHAQLLTKEYCGLNSGEFAVYSGQTENNGIMGRINSFEFDTGDSGVLFSTTVGAKAMHLSHLTGKFSLSQNCMIVVPQSDSFHVRFSFYHFQPLFAFERGLIPEHMQASFRMEDLYQYYSALPPMEEQRRIANFLDYETAKIDTLIEKQQQLIKLLKEKRQAVISHAVTKGLNTDVPMRDSGVELVGEIPEHWEVKRVRHAFDIDNNLRTPIDRQSRVDMEGDYRYFGPTGVLNLINRYNVDGEYFLLGEDGDHFLKFKEKTMTIHVEGQFNVNNHAHLLKGKPGCSTKWGCLYFEHKDLFPWLIKQGVGRYKLQKTVLNDIPVVIPPESEQELILSEVNKKKLAFSKIESDATTLIKVLKERRTALISAAVTGKIDVRNWSAPNA